MAAEFARPGCGAGDADLAGGRGDGYAVRVTSHNSHLNPSHKLFDSRYRNDHGACGFHSRRQPGKLICGDRLTTIKELNR